MGLPEDFPKSPYATLRPESRWFPADEVLRESSYEKLLPPLVDKVRKEVQAWRSSGYAGASATTRALLRWWFDTEHLIEQRDGGRVPFRYYFAQREAVESAIWLYEVRQARDKFDLMRFDSSGAVSPNMFVEDWPRYVLKLATGAGKTKVLSLLITWCYYHRTYEPGSTLSRNFLVIAPNIIVLDRLRADFDGLRIFFNDPLLPDNGYEGRAWREDFQVTLHLQDEVRLVRETGNLFLTNIHRVYLGDQVEASLDDEDTTNYFLEPFGAKPAGKTNDSRTDLGELVRDINELAVFNDEAHHIHDPRMAWFKSIEDIHHRMQFKDKRLSLQIDVTATPRHDNGAIFAQTVADYPLVEAIHQNVVKHPILPDAGSRSKLRERTSAIFSEKYDDYLRLGVEEWRKSYADHQNLGKKAVLFVMVDDTRNCDEVGTYLEKICPELQGAVLIIHTKNNGDIAEAPTGKDKQELEELRKQANGIDSATKSPYKAIVSVLMLKEGWDVRNVTVIVGLRAYSAKANILPEQTLGRGLRRMYQDINVDETVSVIGTPAFMEFVESIEKEGVTFFLVPMGKDVVHLESVVVEIDTQDPKKDLDALDIPLPKLSRRYDREFKDLAGLDPAALGNRKLPLKPFNAEEVRKIVFKAMLDAEIHHTVELDSAGAGDYRSVVGFYANQLLKELRLVGGYDVLYPKVRDFMREHLFEGGSVDLDDPVVLRNLSEPEAGKILYDSFKTAINALTIHDKGTSRIEDYIRLKDTRPFRMDPNSRFLPAKKSIFNRVVGQTRQDGFELAFAAWLDSAETKDVEAFAKNYLAVGFRIDYVKADGDLSTYTPDFIVRTSDGTVTIVETKGREELDVPQKMARLRQWCEDATAASKIVGGPSYHFVYVDQDGFERHKPGSLAALAASFTEYQSN